jgi:MMPL family
VLDAFAAAAWRRPWRVLVLAGVVLAAAIALAVGAPERLGIGSTQLDESAGPDLVVVTEGRVPASSRVYKVALHVIATGIEADPGVETARPAKTPAGARTAAIEVELASSDEGDRQAAIARISKNLDPGPLHVAFTGETATLSAGRDSLGGDLWRLELLVIPLALMILAGAIGLRLIAAPIVTAAFAIAGTLALFRLLGGIADPSLLGAGAGAIVALVLGIELPVRFAGRCREEADLDAGAPALTRAVHRAVPMYGFAALTAALGAAAILATPLPQGPSIALGCALAAGLAAAAALVVTPPLLALELQARLRVDPAEDSIRAPSERFLPRIASAVAGILGRTPMRAAVSVVTGVLVCLVLASPAIDARTRPFDASDLPASAAPAKAAKELTAASSDTRRHGTAAAPDVERFDPQQSLAPDLPLAAIFAAVLIGIAFITRARARRVVLLALGALLPAAAGVGFAVLVFGNGTLAGLLGQARQGPLDTGALAVAATALVAIAAARCAATLDVVSEERRLDPGPTGVGERAAAQILPATLAATLIAVAVTGAIGGADLYAAREFGLTVAAGLAADLLFVRGPALIGLARWGESHRRHPARRRLSLGWRPWRTGTRPPLDETASES